MEIYLGCITIAPKLIEYEFQKLDKCVDTQEYNKYQVHRTFIYIVKLSMDNDEYV